MQDQLSNQIECDFKLKWRLSVRASAHICKTAKEFNSSIELTHGNETIDAKSVIDLASLGQFELLGPEFQKAHKAGDTSLMDTIGRSWTGLKAGSQIRIVVRGVDAANALAAIVTDLSRSDLDYG